jgi:alkyl hydroperoxide reductase subunit F
MTYDTIIIGGGPTGTAASIYAARKQLKALLITDSFGGQSVVSNDIDNWIGDIRISGFDLAQKFEAHIKAQPNLETLIDRVSKIEKIQDTPYPLYQVNTQGDKVFQTKTLILGLGANRRKLNVPGEEKFSAKGVAYCATCDAPFFADQKVAVVGGGNAGLESALDLLAYASEVYLFNRTSELKGDPGTADKIQAHPKFKGVLHNTEVTEIFGETMVTGVNYINNITQETGQLDITGLFIEIGSIPNSDLVKDLVETNQIGEIILNHKYATTSAPGIFAAGDVTDEAYKQNNISAGDAVKAALSAYQYIHKLEE